MKNQAIYQTNLVSESLSLVSEKVQTLSFRQLIVIIRQWILATRPFTLQARFISLILGEEVSALKAFNLVHAFVSFMSMCLLGGNSIVLQVCLMIWAALTIYQCKQDGWSNGKD